MSYLGFITFQSESSQYSNSYPLISFQILSRQISYSLQGMSIPPMPILGFIASQRTSQPGRPNLVFIPLQLRSHHFANSSPRTTIHNDAYHGFNTFRFETSHGISRIHSMTIHIISHHEFNPSLQYFNISSFLILPGSPFDK